jgi:hypothetical protein
MPDAPAFTFTLTALAREAEREVLMREQVFPNRVAAGRMRQADADRRIAMMREIARRLRAEARTDEELPLIDRASPA